MKITTKTKDLLTAVQFASKIINPKISAVSYDHLLLEGEGTSLTVTAHSALMFARHKCESAVEQKVAFGVPGKLFSTFLSGVEGEETVLTVEPSRVTAETGRQKARFSTLASENFLPWKEKPEGLLISMPESTLHGCFKQMVPAVFKDITTRTELAGVCMNLGEDSLTFCASEGHFIAIKSIPFAGSGEWLVPLDVAECALGSLDGNKESLVDVALSEKAVVFTTDSWSVRGSLIDSKFPSGAFDVVEKRTKIRDWPVLVNLKDFRKSLKRATAFTTETFGGVNIEFRKDGIHFQSAGGMHTGEDLLPMECPKEFRFAVNPKYLDSMLAVMDGETVAFDFHSQTEPLLIQDKDLSVVLSLMRLD